MIRRPAVAGAFYPADPETLGNELDGLTRGRRPPVEPAARALLVPHAGYIYSGRIAAETYLAAGLRRRVVILGPNHTGDGEPIAVIEALNICRMEIQQGCYFPEFGLSQKNPVLAFSCHGEVPLQLSYRIQKTRDRQTQAHRHANPLSVTLLPSRGERTGNQNL